MTITIVGLGPSELDKMPVGIYQKIMDKKSIYVRTEDHPVVSELKDLGVAIHSFDYVYEKHPSSFEQVYEEIVNELVELANQQGEIVYAVPGHPNVAEKTVSLLLDMDVEVQNLGGKSFIDDLFSAVSVDPVDGFQLIDSFDLNPLQVRSDQHVIVMQVFDEWIASDVKLSLMEIYPDEHEVFIVDAAGGRDQKVSKIPLYELDRFEGIYNLRSIYIPPLTAENRFNSLDTLIETVQMTYAKDPWLKDQTPESLLTYLKEEALEYIEAVEEEDIPEMINELGDVLIQVFYQTVIAESEGLFTLGDVVNHQNKKLRRRQPHVFGNAVANTPEEADALWKAAKEEERKELNNENR